MRTPASHLAVGLTSVALLACVGSPRMETGITDTAVLGAAIDDNPRGACDEDETVAFLGEPLDVMLTQAATRNSVGETDAKDRVDIELSIGLPSEELTPSWFTDNSVCHEAWGGTVRVDFRVGDPSITTQGTAMVFTPLSTIVLDLTFTAPAVLVTGPEKETVDVHVWRNGDQERGTVVDSSGVTLLSW